MPTKPATHLAGRPRSREYQTRRDPVVSKVHNSAAWQRLRDWYRTHNPLCEDPYKWHEADGVVVPAAHVHHRVPIRQEPLLALVASNLMAVCPACHARLERENGRCVTSYPKTGMGSDLPKKI